MLAFDALDCWLRALIYNVNLNASAASAGVCAATPSADPGERKYCLDLAGAFLGMKSGAAAADVFREAFSRYDNSNFLHYLYANACFREGKTDEYLDFILGKLTAEAGNSTEGAIAVAYCLGRRHYDEVERFFEKCDRLRPDGFTRYSMLRSVSAGHRLEREGRVDEAIAAYRSAMRENESVGIPFNHYFSAALGKYGVSRIEPERRRTGVNFLYMDYLGGDGRFGDTIVQYLVAKGLAMLTGMQLLLPEWYGRRYFAHANEPYIVELEDVEVSSEHDLLALQRLSGLVVRPEVGFLRSVYDNEGFRGFVVRNRPRIREMLRPCGLAASIADKVDSALRSRGNTVISTHVRLGDFLQFCPDRITPFGAYRAWFDEHLGHYDHPVVFLASDDPDGARRALGLDNVVTTADLGIHVEPELSMLYDFAGLCSADVLVSSRSSFSRVSLLFNKNEPEIWYSPKGDMPFEKRSQPIL